MFPLCCSRLYNLRFALLLAISFVGGGCDSRPVAPELGDSPVYHNRREGFRFLVPDGWTQTATANLPGEPFDGELFLVRYRVPSPEMGSQVQILCLHDQSTVDLLKHHAGPSFGVKDWQPVGEPEPVESDELPGQRFVFSAQTQGRELIKEVVCFRRNDRTYSFVGTFWSDDEKARQQIRRALDSVVWTD